MTYTISYEKNSVYQAIGVNAQTAEQATAYFAKYKPTARFIGIREGMESKPGFPVITVPDDFHPAQEAQEAQEKPIQPAKTYRNNQTGETTESAVIALSWHRSGVEVGISRRLSPTHLQITRLTGAKQPEPEDENRAHCKRIARELEAYADSQVYRCPECGEEIRMPDSVGDKYRCPHCHNVADMEDYEQLSVYDFLSDLYDIELRVGMDGEYRSCKIMVACGGPNIYIDTASASVKLYWWTDYAEYPISYAARDEIDAAVEEWRDCR